MVYNRTNTVTKQYIKTYGNEYLTSAHTLGALVQSLTTPRKIMLMVSAGDAIDTIIRQLKRHLAKGDIIIDGGNSHYRDTMRRSKELERSGIHFVGCGVSGGEAGALKGPSLMPGGSRAAWEQIQPIFEAIAARDFSGGPCVRYIGDNGAGHYVKMVHNGIEYGVMQLMAEAYDLLRTVYGQKANKIGSVFAEYNKGKLNSYLFEISVPVLSKKDDLTAKALIDVILDKASQKGTGRWTAIDALERGTSIPTLTEAVFARSVSERKEERLALAKIYRNTKKVPKPPLPAFVRLLESALYAGMLSTYAQGFDLIHATSKEEKWQIDLGEISRIWEGGCIIRAKLLNVLHTNYAHLQGEAPHLLALPNVRRTMRKNIPHLRTLVAIASAHGVPIPALASALYYFESITRDCLPANFIQGLRDYFGAHTYKRIDREGTFHTDWKE